MTRLKCIYLGNVTYDLAFLAEKKDAVLRLLYSWNLDAYLRNLNDDLSFEIAIRDDISGVILEKFRDYFHDKLYVETEVLE